MTERPILFSAPMVRALLAGRKTQTRRIVDSTRHTEDPSRCPYGVLGDRLWVKETIQFDSTDGDRDRALYAADSAPTKLDTWPWKRRVLSSIHCPRGLSRITLKVTEVRVQRLQEISEDDALAEGVLTAEMMSPREVFAQLWDSINGERAPWSSNPWVWALTFKNISAEIASR